MGHRAVHGAAVDSRLVRPGVAFFALPGERTDGHRFLADAIAAGAAALVVSDAPAASAVDALAAANDVTIILVGDTGAALRGAAAAWRDRFDPLVVGITGSLAKTSTKEVVADVLAERWTVLRNEGNRNNEVGLPLTLLDLGPEHGAAVLEMGLYVRGDIALLCGIARPSVGVVTAVRGVHLSRAGSIDAIVEGKRELVEALPADGVAVLNADDPRVAGMAGASAARVVRYGFSPEADVTASDVSSLGTQGMRFRLRLPDAGEVEVTMPALGRHSVHNGLAAAAVGHAAGLDAPAIARGLARGSRAPHRTTLIETPRWRVLDDSYNAAPDSMAAALDLLASLPGRRIAVLGEMLELGIGSREAHRAVGRLVPATADRLVAVGSAGDDIAAGAIEAGMDAGDVLVIRDRVAARALLLADAAPGDTFLVKASRGVELDVLVGELVAAGGGPLAGPEASVA
ncbi:MAG: UDP-N-acetylmuramoyl-tripeptide--D-alanyl-D-alanine ligase [Candidatus Limnocylindrales bacterium]